ncbi:hypothetical protein SNE40_014182 [Patella caerulea]|uniref:Uncharacterized protein n=1 Tax=Patella caerulea TaxID=87958 RepID=A0AAN8JDZ9_PATCE
MTLFKAKQANSDPQLALLNLRLTPLTQNIPSPGEISMGRKLRTNFNVPCRQQPNRFNETIREQLQTMKQTQKEYHDRSCKDLQPLYTRSTSTRAKL